MSATARQIELLSNSPEQTRRLGAALARQLAGGDVVALVGPLGAGKTQWVKGLAAGLGIDPDEVHSPTFTLINEYRGTGHLAPPANHGQHAPAAARGGGAGLGIYHVDAYRLRGPAELEAIGFAELLAARDSIVAVEWADRVAELIPPGAVWIEGWMPAELAPTQRRYLVRCSRPQLLVVLDDGQ